MPKRYPADIIYFTVNEKISFKTLHLKPGTIMEYIDPKKNLPKITCKIINDLQVQYKHKQMSLTKATYNVHKEFNLPRITNRACLYWTINGEKLYKIKRRIIDGYDKDTKYRNRFKKICEILKIPIGATLEYLNKDNTNYKCKLIEDGYVQYKSKKYTILQLNQKLLKEKPINKKMGSELWRYNNQQIRIYRYRLQKNISNDYATRKSTYTLEKLCTKNKIPLNTTLELDPNLKYKPPIQITLLGNGYIKYKNKKMTYDEAQEKIIKIPNIKINKRKKIRMERWTYKNISIRKRENKHKKQKG